jgi:hypothetical protein
LGMTTTVTAAGWAVVAVATAVAAAMAAAAAKRTTTSTTLATTAAAATTTLALMTATGSMGTEVASWPVAKAVGQPKPAVVRMRGAAVTGLLHTAGRVALWSHPAAPHLLGPHWHPLCTPEAMGAADRTMALPLLPPWGLAAVVAVVAVEVAHPGQHRAAGAAILVLPAPYWCWSVR